MWVKDRHHWIKDRLSPAGYKLYFVLCVAGGLWVAVSAALDIWPVSVAHDMQQAIFGGDRVSLTLSVFLVLIPVGIGSLVIAWACDRIFGWAGPLAVSTHRERETPIAGPSAPSPGAQAVDTDRRPSAGALSIVQCTACGRRVVIKPDGSCPSCQTTILGRE